MSADTHVVHAGPRANHGHGSLRRRLPRRLRSVGGPDGNSILACHERRARQQAATALTIMVFAAAQIVVHMIFFLHMSARSENGWTMMALIFTLVIVASRCRVRFG